ncbi:unnamed protein product, partial [Prorocentrum cordatum]
RSAQELPGAAARGACLQAASLAHSAPRPAQSDATAAASAPDAAALGGPRRSAAGGARRGRVGRRRPPCRSTARRPSALALAWGAARLLCWLGAVAVHALACRHEALRAAAVCRGGRGRGRGRRLVLDVPVGRGPVRGPRGRGAARQGEEGPHALAHAACGRSSAGGSGWSPRWGFRRIGDAGRADGDGRRRGRRWRGARLAGRGAAARRHSGAGAGRLRVARAGDRRSRGPRRARGRLRETVAVAALLVPGLQRGVGAPRGGTAAPLVGEDDLQRVRRARRQAGVTRAAVSPAAARERDRRPGAPSQKPGTWRAASRSCPSARRLRRRAFTESSAGLPLPAAAWRASRSAAVQDWDQT